MNLLVAKVGITSDHLGENVKMGWFSLEHEEETDGENTDACQNED